MVRLSDWQTENVICPACKASLTLSVDVSIDAALEYKTSSDGAYWNREDKGGMEIIGGYQRRIPNFGLCGNFFKACYGDAKFLCNGYFALKNIDGLELAKAEGYKDEVDLTPAMEKFSDPSLIWEVFPDEMTSGLARVTGGGFDRIFIRRYLDFIYTVFPDAGLYACKAFEGMAVKNGEGICGFVMAMKDDPATNPWAGA